jgi:hypothetical protein
MLEQEKKVGVFRGLEAAVDQLLSVVVEILD